jgi:hypothetical protein
LKIKLIFCTGGHTSLIPKDFEQARDLLYRRIKLDSLSIISSIEEREKARTKFMESNSKAYPLQVIWIYLKCIRFMKLGGTKISLEDVVQDSELPSEEIEGPEDVIARGKSLSSLRHLGL